MPQTLFLDAGLRLHGEATLRLAASVWLPPRPAAASLVWLCLAGGNMNRRYFDLQVEGDDSFSFAAQMTRRGYIVMALDHLGLGDSSRPVDGYALTPACITRASHHATQTLLTRLREGHLLDGLAALPAMRSIGLGHSMGAMLTVLQQAQSNAHAAIALLGFSTRGLPQFLPPDVHELAERDPLQLRERLPEFARRMFVQPYPVIRSAAGGASNAELYGSAKADPRGVRALRQATDCLLPVPALLAMVPGNVAVEAAQIRAPVFIGLGEHDMAGPPQQAPAAFTASAAVSLQVLPDAGHSHFLFESRVALFEGLDQWARGLPR